MIRRVYISFNEGRKNYRKVRSLLDTIDCADGLAGEDHFLCGLYGRMFDERDPKLQVLRSLLSRERIEWSERIEDHYDDSELRSFPLLDLSVDRKEIDPYGPTRGTTYDLSTGCPQCGTGATQTSPFLAPPRSLPKTGLLCASSSETFVATPLADALRAEDVSGIELRQVLSSTDRTPLPWFQIVSSFEMPKMAPSTKGIIRSSTLPPCPRCQRDGHYHTVKEPLQIVYDSASLTVGELPDVVHTWECFGRSGIHAENFRYSRFAPPLILVNRKVFEIFRAMRVKHARFTPVRFV